MSSNKRHGTAESRALRSIPKLPRLDRRLDDVGDNTLVDVRAIAPKPARRVGSIPSIVGKPSTTTPPPNVIPFTKPRAIAALAAQQPDAVVIEPPKAPLTLDGPSTHAPLTHAPLDRHAPSKKPPTQAPVFDLPTSVVPAIAPPPASRVATGWTPPGAVPVVKPRAPVVPPIATLYPAPSAQAIAPAVPAPVIPLPALPAPVIAPPAPASQPPPPPAVASAPTLKRPALQLDLEPPPADPKWSVYESIGLGRPKLPNAQQAAKLVVNAYRLLGFTILTLIVIVLVGYIAQTVFFYFSDSWVEPIAISASDEKVVSLEAQLAEQQNTRDRIADELTQTERTIEAQQAFQLQFAKAIKSDLDGRKAALSRIRALASSAASTRRAIKNENSAYASASRRKMAEEYKAGLIDRAAMLSGKYQIAQISSSNLSLAERQAEFETRAAELEAQTRSLDAILANTAATDTTLSYEVLRIKQEYEASRLDLAKSIEARDTLRANLERQDRIVKSLQQTSYLRAVHDHASVAFVPYGNLSNVKPGNALYACRAGMIICRKVGEILEVLPGEVQFKHPHRDKVLRGQMVEIKLDANDSDAAADDVLFAGGKPFLF
ncbi:MAG TPA: hypothetical protein VFQ53_36855 [Kofleriaceae bacterium]|nr:hypothetical protein [Kofleriaceae bacterium]